jgi:DNA-binding GntR family transcriptional regulator
LSFGNGDARPLYEQVADALRRRIERGELAPGASISSEAALQSEYQVSRDTVRKALTQLTHEGLLTSGQGRTRQVRRNAPLRWALATLESRRELASAPDEAGDAWSRDVQRQGRRPAETIELAIVIPPAKVAELLRINSTHDVAVLRKRVRFVDDRPYQLADSYFPESIVRDTPLMEPRSVYAPGGILASIGYQQARYFDEIAIRMPTPSESDRLDLPAGTPVAEVTRVGYVEDGTPVRVMISVAPGDRNILVYHVDAS